MKCILYLRSALVAASSLHRGLTALLLLAICSGLATARSTMIIAPHPDDEALMAAGIIYSAVHRGEDVNVVVVTNGDYRGIGQAPVREAETVAAMNDVGVAEDHIIFLGYGDATLWNLWKSRSPTAILRSAAGQTHTYASRGLGGTDYHSYLHNKPGNYNRITVLNDFKSVIVKFHPDDIYTTSFYDDHPDHRATNAFLVSALISLPRTGFPLRARVHETFVHSPGSCSVDPHCSSMGWPRPVNSPELPFAQPPTMACTPFRWDQIERIPVPREMQDPEQTRNLKYLAIAEYHSQAPPPGHSNWLEAFVKKDEFFWRRDFSTNLALNAKISVSSENRAARQLGVNVADGIVAGDPLDPTAEWATIHGLEGSWIKLSWPSPVKISGIALYDRPNLLDNVLAGVLLFSDGSEITVGPLPQNGVGLPITFPAKTVKWMKYRIERAVGQSTGLAELEVYGIPARSSLEPAPLIIRGPQAIPPTIDSAGISNLKVDAFSPDGTQVDYKWSVDAGAVVGSGSSAVFRGPKVSREIVATITVAVQDQHGSVTSNTTFVTVRAPDSVLHKVKVWLLERARRVGLMLRKLL